MPAFKQRHPLFGWTRGTQFGCTRRAVHVWHVWEIKARTEGRGFCRHKEDFCRGTILQFQQMFPFGIAVCGGLFFYSTSNISLIWNFFFFFNATNAVNLVSPGFTSLLLRKEKASPFTKSDWNPETSSWHLLSSREKPNKVFLWLKLLWC